MFVSDDMVKELSMAAQEIKGGVKKLLHGTVSVTSLAVREAKRGGARAPGGGPRPQEPRYGAV